MPLSRIAPTTSGRPVVLCQAPTTFMPVSGSYFQVLPPVKSSGRTPGARKRYAWKSAGSVHVGGEHAGNGNSARAPALNDRTANITAATRNDCFFVINAETITKRAANGPATATLRG